MNTTPNRRIIIIDDNSAIHADFRKILGTASKESAVDALVESVFGDTPAVPAPAATAAFELDFASQGQEGLAKVEAAVRDGRRYAIAFVDMRMPPGWDGIETACRLWQADPDLQIVICTAYSNVSWEQIFDQLGRASSLLILKKPFDNAEVLQLAHALTEKWQLTQESRHHVDDLSRLVHERTAQLEAASRAKDEFLANMSHEIRTPLNAVIGLTDLLIETEMTAIQREYLSLIRNSGRTLLGVINDILDFSKIEAGKLELDPVPFKLRRLLDDTARLLALSAEEKNLELLCRVAPEVPEALVGDALRVRQVLLNLVNNAIKFTERGEVFLDVSLAPAEAGALDSESVILNFAVRDTGIGIPAGRVGALFTPFTQVDGSTTRRFGGTGLGLAISHRLATLLGGRLWVESEESQGSTFQFTARFAPADASGAGIEPADPGILRGLPVLVVDDNATHRRLLEELLRHWGLIPTSADNAPAALAELRRAADTGQPYRLTLLDSQMPCVNGLKLAACIRAMPGLAPATVMMLTSSERLGDLARNDEDCLPIFLIKPVSPHHLLAAVLKALGQYDEGHTTRFESATPPAVIAPSGHPCRLKILLAEDNRVNQRLAIARLEKLGHTIALAENGRLVLESLSRDRFDLVLMDVHMPELDGYETTTAIRAQEAATGGRIPIIAMTANALVGDREKCLAAGMDDYISKPIEVEALKRALSRVQTGAISTDTTSPVSSPQDI